MAEPLWTAEEILAATGGRLDRGPFAVTGVSIDTRTLEPGDLFVALAGARDGHEFAPQALAKGAAGVLAARPVDGPAVIVEDTLKALEALKCPQVMILIFSFMYRYVFVVEDEFMKMRQAKKSRSVHHSWWREVKCLSNMIAVLFLRSCERAEAVYLAMCSRGFKGSVPYHPEFRLAFGDMVFLAVIVISLAAIRYVEYIHV